MRVVKDLVVSVAYQIFTEEGVLVDEYSLEKPLDYLHGYGCLITGLENALEGCQVGDRFEINVSASNGYGNYEENLIQRVPKEIFMDAGVLETGMRFLVETDSGQVPVTVTGIDNEHVVIDGNHMFAGKNLHCNAEVVAIREATAEELNDGRTEDSDALEYDSDSCHHGGCGCH